MADDRVGVGEHVVLRHPLSTWTFDGTGPSEPASAAPRVSSARTGSPSSASQRGRVDGGPPGSAPATLPNVT